MRKGWVIGDLDARVRLRRQVDNEARLFDEPPPSDKQIAMVLHALADHTAIMQALEYAPPEDGYWPQATSVGRWLHDYGDLMQGAR